MVSYHNIWPYSSPRPKQKPPALLPQYKTVVVIDGNFHTIIKKTLNKNLQKIYMEMKERRRERERDRER